MDNMEIGGVLRIKVPITIPVNLAYLGATIERAVREAIEAKAPGVTVEASYNKTYSKRV